MSWMSPVAIAVSQSVHLSHEIYYHNVNCSLYIFFYSIYNFLHCFTLFFFLFTHSSATCYYAKCHLHISLCDQPKKKKKTNFYLQIDHCLVTAQCLYWFMIFFYIFFFLNCMRNKFGIKNNIVMEYW